MAELVNDQFSASAAPGKFLVDIFPFRTYYFLLSSFRIFSDMQFAMCRTGFRALDSSVLHERLAILLIGCLTNRISK